MCTEQRHVETECWQGMKERKLRSISLLVNGLDFISKRVDAMHCMLSRLLVSQRIIRDQQTTMFRDGRWRTSSWPSYTKRRPSKVLVLTEKLRDRFLQTDFSRSC
jgi:hypothetical protein